MTRQTIEALLLDMGGVILQMAGSRGFPASRLDWRGRQALVHAIAAAGGKAGLNDLERLVFAPWRVEYERREETATEAGWTPFLDRLRQQAGFDLDDLELLQPWFGPYSEHLVPIDNAIAALRELELGGFKMALVSNVPLPGELYSQLLRKHGIEDVFEGLYFSYDWGTRKPSPALLRMAMRTLGSRPDNTIMVGDRRDRDIAAGRFAGTRTVWIRTADGGGPAADADIASLAELPELLNRWQR